LSLSWASPKSKRITSHLVRVNRALTFSCIMMNGTPTNEMAGVSEKVLKNITELYEHGLSPGAHGSIGVCAMAQDLGLHKQIRKPRKKIRSAETACWQ